MIISADFLRAGLGFAISIVVLKNLDTESIALLYPLVSLLMIATQFGDLGLSGSFIAIVSPKILSDHKGSQKLYNGFFQIKLLLSFVVLLFGWIFAPFVNSYFFEGLAAHTMWIRLTLVAGVASIVASFYATKLQSEKRFRHLSILKVVPTVMKFAVLVMALGFFQLDFRWAFVAFMMVPLVSLVLGGVVNSHTFLRYRSPLLQTFSGHWVLIFWVMISMVANVLFSQADILMLKALSSVDEVARYVGGQRLAAVFPVINAGVMTVLFPVVSAYKNTSEMKNYVKKLFVLLPIVLFGGLIVAMLAPWIIEVILGVRYESSVIVFQILVFQFAFGFFLNPLTLMLFRLNKTHFLAGLNIVQLILNVLGNAYLIPQMGAMGAAVTTLVIPIVTAVFLFFPLRQGFKA